MAQTQQVQKTAAWDFESDREFDLWEDGSLDISDVALADGSDASSELEFVRLNVAQARALRAFLNSERVRKVLDSK